jgi:hypothetical protein
MASSRLLLLPPSLGDARMSGIRQQPAPGLGVGEQEGVVDHYQVRLLSLRPGAVHEAVLGRASDADAVERVRAYVRPEHLLPALEAQLGTVAGVSLVKPDHDLELELELLGILAGLHQVPSPAPE